MAQESISSKPLPEAVERMFKEFHIYHGFYPQKQCGICVHYRLAIQHAIEKAEQAVRDQERRLDPDRRKAIARVIEEAKLEQAEKMHVKNCGCCNGGYDARFTGTAFCKGPCDQQGTHDLPRLDYRCVEERDRLRREIGK